MTATATAFDKAKANKADCIKQAWVYFEKAIASEIANKSMSDRWLKLACDTELLAFDGRS